MVLNIVKISKLIGPDGGADQHGRGDRIRTYGLCFPKAALYQAELHPEG